MLWTTHLSQQTLGSGVTCRIGAPGRRCWRSNRLECVVSTGRGRTIATRWGGQENGTFSLRPCGRPQTQMRASGCCQCPRSIRTGGMSLSHLNGRKSFRWHCLSEQTAPRVLNSMLSCASGMAENKFEEGSFAIYLYRGGKWLEECLPPARPPSFLARPPSCRFLHRRLRTKLSPSPFRAHLAPLRTSLLWQSSARMPPPAAN